MSNEIAKSPEMLLREAEVKELREQLKKGQAKLKSLKTRLKNTQSSIEEIQRKVQTETLRKMEQVDNLRKEVAALALKMKKMRGLSASDKRQLQMMADDMLDDSRMGEGYENYKAYKEQESGGFNFEEHERASMRDMFEPFQVKPEEKELKDIRKVFLKLSQKFHPDLAKDEREAKEFHLMQQQINEAYQNNDIQNLLELENAFLLEELDFSKSITADVLQQEIDRLKRDLDFIKSQIKRTSEEVKNLRLSDFGKMLSSVKKFEREGDGFDGMNAEIDQAIQTFTMLRDGFKESIEMGRMSPNLVTMLMGGQDEFDDDDLSPGFDVMNMLQKLAEGDDDALDLFGDLFDDEMEVENPEFPIGSSVRVRAAIGVPFYKKIRMKGWEGRVIAAYYNEREQVAYQVSFDSVTIGQMPEKLFKAAVDREEDFQDVEILEHQLEASLPRDEEEDALIAYRKAFHQYAWAFLNDPTQVERLQKILLALPERSDHENWDHHFEEQVTFPFTALTRGETGSPAGIEVKVLGIDFYSEDFGHIVSLKVKGERKPQSYPLFDLMSIDHGSPVFQLLDDYFEWADEVLTFED